MSSVLATGRVSGRFGRGLHALLSGVWLGLLSDGQLRRLDERYYARDPLYLSESWNSQGLSPWEQKAVTHSFQPGSRLVVPACGGGREILALLQQGYDATGYEPHPELVGYARTFMARHGHPGRALPMRRDRFPDVGSCDGVLVGWGGYSLIAPRAARLQFLRDLATAAVPGAAVVLSAFARPRHDRALRLTRSVALRLRRMQRRDGDLELGDTLAPNRVHVFTVEELADELRQAGLGVNSCNVVDAAGADTDYLCAVARVS